MEREREAKEEKSMSRNINRKSTEMYRHNLIGRFLIISAQLATKHKPPDHKLKPILH